MYLSLDISVVLLTVVLFLAGYVGTALYYLDLALPWTRYL